MLESIKLCRIYDESFPDAKSLREGWISSCRNESAYDLLCVPTFLGRERQQPKTDTG
jgi:hypothetical protein